LICRLLERETEDLLTAAAVEAAGRIREPRAVAPLRRFVARYARQAMTRFLVVRCLEAIFEILGTAAAGEMAFLFDQKHAYQSLYPFLKRCYDAIGLPAPAEVDSRSRIWLEEQRRAREVDRYVASLVDEIHEARKTGLPLAVIAAADTVKLRLVYNEIALDHFLMAYHQLRFRVSSHESKYIPLNARELAEKWWIGGFWRNP
jgi:hypothetical protein